MKNRIMWLTLTGLCALIPAACAEVNEVNAVYGDYGKVIAAETTEKGARIEAEGYYGYHMDLNPSMTVSVEIAPDGTILAASVVAAKDQTQGFDAMITQAYMDETYVGQIADPAMETEAVSGATVTSRAVRYAVQTAANYAQKELGYVADTSKQEQAVLNAVYPATYTTIQTDYQPDTKKTGTILYAAEGVAEDGTQVVAMKIKSATKVKQTGSAKTGWDASIPNPYTMIIVVNKDDRRVCAWSIVTDGTRNADYFTVPDEKINAYETVEITDETAFDSFMDGLVLTLDVDYTTEESSDGPVITGTSIVYTGQTEQGTFSSQMVRNCFKAAAAMFCHCIEQ